jgi:hypothetical protein
MKLINQNYFASVLLSHISSHNIVSNDNIAKKLQMLSKADAVGLWRDVAKDLKITAKQAHDYYHNTFQLQYFDKLCPHLTQLREVVDTNSYLSKE